jgi:hypothetical protein
MLSLEFFLVGPRSLHFLLLEADYTVCWCTVEYESFAVHEMFAMFVVTVDLYSVNA